MIRIQQTRHKIPPASLMANPDISVIVCTYNRADWLGEAIESLTKLETGDYTYEVLVIDNASSDNTPEVVKEFAEKTSACTIRYVREGEPGVSFARNRGLQESAATWIAFFDDDEIAEPDWLLQLMNAAEEHNVKCVGGGVRLKLDEGSDRKLKPWVRIMLGSTDTMTAQMYDGKRVPTTGNMLIHTEIFEKIGMFRTDLVEGGEDTDVYHRARKEGYEAWHAPQALTHHQIPPFRIEPKYLRSTSMRMGSHIARREFEDYGLLKFPLVALARLAKTVLVYIPKLLLAKIGGDKEAILEQNCYWWMWKGYLGAAFRLLVSKKEANNPLSFRQERQFASAD